MSWQYPTLFMHHARRGFSALRSGLFLGGVVALSAATSPQITGKTLPPAAPALQQSVTLEFGESGHPTSMTLCETSMPVVVFEEPIEEQVYLVMKAYPMGLTDELRRLTAKAIVQESRANDLDPWLVVGLIRVESSFWNYSVSNKDAMGLMQLLPYVGHAVADDTGVPWNGPETLFHPVKNVKLGTAYLARLVERFGGNHERALQAYNVGPTRISRWMRNGRSLPTEYSGAVSSFWKQYSAAADSPDDQIRIVVATAEKRYGEWQHTRMVAALQAMAVEEAPADLADALNAGVNPVDSDRADTDLLETPEIPDAPLELPAANGDDLLGELPAAGVDVLQQAAAPPVVDY